jgi:hypothetical protein
MSVTFFFNINWLDTFGTDYVYFGSICLFCITLTIENSPKESFLEVTVNILTKSQMHNVTLNQT